LDLVLINIELLSLS